MQKDLYKTRPVFVLFGDSITQYGILKDGWGTLLQDYYEHRIDVLNRGMSGYNTEMVLPFVETIFSDLKHVSLVTICFGANDAATDEQHVPLNDYEKNISKIIDIIKQIHPKCKILLVSPPMMDEIQFEKTCKQKFGKPLNRFVKITEKYVNVMEKVAKEKNLPFLNLFDKMKEATDLLEDGLHLSKKGNYVFFTNIVEKIENEFPEFKKSKMPYPFPHWSILLKKSNH